MRNKRKINRRQMKANGSPELPWDVLCVCRECKEAFRCGNPRVTRDATDEDSVIVTIGVPARCSACKERSTRLVDIL